MIKNLAKTPKKRESKFSGLIGLLVELSNKDDNIESILDPIIGPIAEIKGHLVIFNVRVRKLPTKEEMNDYLLKNKIPFDKIYDGNPSPSMGFLYNSKETEQRIFINFYHPREHYY